MYNQLDCVSCGYTSLQLYAKTLSGALLDIKKRTNCKLHSFKIQKVTIRIVQILLLIPDKIIYDYGSGTNNQKPFTCLYLSECVWYIIIFNLQFQTANDQNVYKKMYMWVRFSYISKFFVMDLKQIYFYISSHQQLY